MMNTTNSMDQLFLEKVQSSIENNYPSPSFNVDCLAREVGVSRYQLNRRLKGICGKPPSRMIREFRLQKAFEMLQIRSWTISEIAYQVGFSSPSYFNACFKKHFGYPPGKVKPGAPARKLSRHFQSPKAIYVSFVVIAGLIMLNVITRTRQKEFLDKSIAVLPFINDSSDEENTYFINGTMESILNNLSTIKDLRVISRSSVERFRDSVVHIPTIADELFVSYLLIGSMQKYGNHIRLFVQLIDRNDNQVWSDQYDREITTVEENLSLQSEIAQLVARELQAVITPEEKQLIEKIPTTNAIAYEFYQRGMNEYWNFNHPDRLKNAETMFRYALDYDSSFALAYVGLAQVYIPQYHLRTYFSEDFMDSVLVLAETALSFDSELSEAYEIIGNYYNQRGRIDLAVEEYDKAISLNPNAWGAYYGKALSTVNDDLHGSIVNAHKAASLHRGPALPYIYFDLSNMFVNAGFDDLSLNYLEEYFSLAGDSMLYYIGLTRNEWMKMNFNKELYYLQKVYQFDSSRTGILFDLGYNYMDTQQYKLGLEFYKRYIDKAGPDIGKGGGRLHRIGYSFWVNGFEEEGLKYFDLCKEYCLETLKLGRFYSAYLGTNYDLACIYAFLGEKDKAFENLRIVNQKDRFTRWWLVYLKTDPLLDTIRDDPEFQQILSDVEAKYQAEHDRVRQWLEENNML